MVKYNKMIGKVVGYMGIDNTMFSGCALYGTFLNCIFRKQSYLKQKGSIKMSINSFVGDEA